MRSYDVKFTVTGESTYFTFSYTVNARDAVIAIDLASAKLVGSHKLEGMTIAKVLAQPNIKDKE